MGQVISASFEKKLLSLRDVGLDTMCFLYHFGAHSTYGPLTKILFSCIAQKRTTAITSTISVVETFVHAEQTGDDSIIGAYEKTFRSFPNLRVLDVDWHTARLASKLRAHYRGLKTADAIQIASALLADCKGFITNDDQLKKVKEIEVVVLKEFL